MLGWATEDKRKIVLTGERGTYEVYHCVAKDDAGRERYRYQLRTTSHPALATFYNRETLLDAIRKEKKIEVSRASDSALLKDLIDQLD